MAVYVWFQIIVTDALILEKESFTPYLYGSFDIFLQLYMFHWSLLA